MTGVDDDVDGPSLYTHGTVQFKSTFTGYLPMSLLGIMLMFSTLFLAYAGTLIWYGHSVMERKRRSSPTTIRPAKPSEKWICTVLALGLLETTADVGLLVLLNLTGQTYVSMIVLQNACYVLKMSLSLCLGLYLAQAAGMPALPNGPGTALASENRVYSSRGLLRFCLTLYGGSQACSGVARPS